MQIHVNKKTHWIIELLIVGLVALLLMHGYEAYSESGIIDSKLFDLTLKHFIQNPFQFRFEAKAISFGLFTTLFFYCLFKSKQFEKKKNMQEHTYGSSGWEKPSALKNNQEKDITKNFIFTSSEYISYNMRVSDRNRNVAVIGSPGTGKSRYFLKANILNAYGSMVITDPKGELIRDCGQSLINRGYRIKVLNLDNMYCSDHYNPFDYIKKMPSEAYELNGDEGNFEITDVLLREDDVMSLINLIMTNTEGEMKSQNKTGDPFWQKAEMLLLQACFFYVLFNMRLDERNLTSVIKLLKLAKKDEKDDYSQLDLLFMQWKEKAPDHIGVKQYDHYKSATGKMEKTIIMTAVARLSVFNIDALSKITCDDTLDLNDFGAKDDKGKIALFIVTKPTNSTFNFLATLVYTQLFQLLDTNAELAGGSLPTAVNLFIDEFANIGEIPRFLETLAYVRGLNVGITFIIQSLDQLKKMYKDDWETALDCCDYILFLGAKSKSTLQWVSEMLGKQTLYKKNSSRTFGPKGSNSSSWDLVGRELAFMDEIRKMKKGDGILFISSLNPFYSKLYDITKHPAYEDLYEPWNEEKTKHNRYDHHIYLKQHLEENILKNQLRDLGIQGTLCDIIPQHISMKELRKMKLVDPDEFNHE